jgi:chemotaxis protein methyltransferase CheR
MTLVKSLLESATLSDSQFAEISTLVKDQCGINLHDGKKELVKARLSKRLRALGLTRFHDYLALVQADPTGNELVAMLDALSTNLTRFFREPDHFVHLEKKVAERVAAGPRRLRVWSAGCSSGEEPYSIAMTLAERIRDWDRWDIAILATDLSTAVLDRAARGQYDAERAASVPPALRQRYFDAEGDRHSQTYRIADRLRQKVRFARLNLMGSWPMRGPFDVIFCRNVMIYFDKPTQSRLVGRFHEMLAPGGTLFVGHSESLAGVSHSFTYVQPTIYQKT